MIFRRKPKPLSGIEMKHILNLELGCFENFDLYYSMYVGAIKNRDYSKIDGVVGSLAKLFDRDQRFNDFYDRQMILATNQQEKDFVEASRQFILVCANLTKDICQCCIDNKNKLKKNEEIQDTLMNTRIDDYTRRYEKVFQSKENRDHYYLLLSHII